MSNPTSKYLILTIILSLVLVPLHLFAGKKNKEYLDLHGRNVNKKEAYFYRIGEPGDGNTWNVTEYYMEDDKIKLQGTYKTSALKIKHGMFMEYYPNGKIKFSGQFEDGKEQGEIQEWFGSGNVKSIRHYKYGIKHGLEKAWYDNGNLLVEVNFVEGKMDGPYKEWYSNGEFYISGTYKNGHMDGEWKWHYDNGRRKRTENYTNFVRDFRWDGGYPNGRKSFLGYYDKGKQINHWKWYSYEGQTIRHEEFDEDGNMTLIFSSGEEYDNIDNHDFTMKQVYQYVESPAQPLGGMYELHKYLKTYTDENLPSDAKKAKTRGIVFVSFEINEQGVPEKFEIAKGIGHGCDELCVKALRSYGKWSPARHRGKIVRQSFKIPVRVGF